ncbi:unnamed protein product, partial [Scytosiphon promiscuus]
MQEVEHNSSSSLWRAVSSGSKERVRGLLKPLVLVHYPSVAYRSYGSGPGVQDLRGGIPSRIQIQSGFVPRQVAATGSPGSDCGVMEAPGAEHAPTTRQGSGARQVFVFGSSPPFSAPACHRASSAPSPRSLLGVIPSHAQLVPFPTSRFAAPAGAASTPLPALPWVLDAATGVPVFLRQGADQPSSSSRYGAAAVLPSNSSSRGRLLLPKPLVRIAPAPSPSASRIAISRPLRSSAVSQAGGAAAAGLEGSAFGRARLSTGGGRAASTSSGRTASLPNLSQ